jgi:hypothetical protein
VFKALNSPGKCVPVSASHGCESFPGLWHDFNQPKKGIVMSTLHFKERELKTRRNCLGKNLTDSIFQVCIDVFRYYTFNWSPKLLGDLLILFYR